MQVGRGPGPEKKRGEKSPDNLTDNVTLGNL